MSAQLRSELRKLRTTRTNLGLLVGMVLLLLLTVLLNGLIPGPGELHTVDNQYAFLSAGTAGEVPTSVVTVTWAIPVPAGMVALTWVSSAPGTLATLLALLAFVLPAGAPTGVKVTALAWVSLVPVMVTCWPPAGSPLGGETPDTSGGT